jgi:hypothetical protein
MEDLTFSKPAVLTDFIQYRAFDEAEPEPIPIPPSSVDDRETEEEGKSQLSIVRDCGDFSNHCVSGYTFFRRDPSPRATADQLDQQYEWVYVIYDATKPGTKVPTGTTYSSVTPGVGSQSGVYFTRLDGVTGTHTAPILIDNQAVGHQFFPVFRPMVANCTHSGGILVTIRVTRRLGLSGIALIGLSCRRWMFGP